MRKTGRGQDADQRGDGEHGADAGRHAATAVEAQEDRAPGADDGGHADQRQDHVRRLEVHGDEHGHGTLAAVEQPDRDAARPAHRPQRVGAAGPAAADLAGVDAAGQLGHQDAGRDGPDEVGDQQEQAIAEPRVGHAPSIAQHRGAAGRDGRSRARAAPDEPASRTVAGSCASCRRHRMVRGLAPCQTPRPVAARSWPGWSPPVQRCSS